jgi:hypothetical protein
METVLQEQYDKRQKNIEKSSGDRLGLGLKLDEVARAEKVFELIAQRTVELQTERGAPARIKLMREAKPPDAPIEAVPYGAVLFLSLTAFSLPFLGLLVFSAMSWIVSACFPVVKRRLPRTPASDSRG